MAKDTRGYELRTHWKKCWETPYKDRGKIKSRGPFRGNVHRDAAQLKAIAEDIGVEEAKRLIDFYFEVHADPDFMWYLYNYDKLRDEADRRDEDREHRQRLREATRRRMEELGLEPKQS